MGGVRDEPVGGRIEVISAEERGARSVTHLAGPPTSQVPPWYM